LPLQSTLQHVCYLSADFQLFLLSVVIIQVFKNKKWWAACIFALLSVVSCGIPAWQVHGNHIPPFMVPVAEELSTDPRSTCILQREFLYCITVVDTLNDYYILPFYHAV
ncbi:unnamed protein product, partial [Ixodes pacificus]